MVVDTCAGNAGRCGDVNPAEQGYAGVCRVSPAELVPVMTRLRSGDPGYDLFLMHTAVDRPGEKRIELFYLLMSTKSHEQAWVTVSIPREKPEIESLSGLWPIAQYQEREVYDMFGVVYGGHPDLRRILLEDGWEGYPLRKDYSDPFVLEKPQVEKVTR